MIRRLLALNLILISPCILHGCGGTQAPPQQNSITDIPGYYGNLPPCDSIPAPVGDCTLQATPSRGGSSS